MAIDPDKYKRMFIDEAREGLAAFSNELVSVEKSLERAQGDVGALDAGKSREIMDQAFRTAHSLKGMAASVGYERFAGLAHRMEDLADLFRQGKALDANAFDLLLEGTDWLEAMVEHIEATGSDVRTPELETQRDELVARLQAATLRLKPGAVAAAPAKPAPPEPADGESDGVSVRVVIAADASLPQVRAFVAHKALSQLPGYRETVPSPEQLRTRDLPDRSLVVRFDPAVADLEQVVAVARQQQGVADATVVRAAPKAPVEAPAPAPAVERGAEEERTVRVKTALLDDLIDSVGELMLARSRLRGLSARHDDPDLLDLVDEMERLVRELHGRIVQARMTPLSVVTERLPRVVRDLARQSDKAIDLVMSGTEIEVDRAILDQLFAPLLHLVRNAVDHAHEGKDERAKRGKPPAMRLGLSAARERDQVIVTLKDDGRGIDPARVRARAVERGLVDAAAAAALSDAAAVELVCLPGFSTADTVSEISGRGVGMDVVKATVERLGGSLSIASTVGQGTSFRLELPLTVAIIQVLVVEAGGLESEAYAIPVNRVERAIDLDPARVSQSRGRFWMDLDGELIPLFDLGAALGYEDGAGVGHAAFALPDETHRLQRGGTAIVVGRGNEQCAFRVDGIVGQEEVVAKPLGRPLASWSFLAGATLLADGRAAYILEPTRLVSR